MTQISISLDGAIRATSLAVLIAIAGFAVSANAQQPAATPPVAANPVAQAAPVAGAVPDAAPQTTPLPGGPNAGPQTPSQTVANGPAPNGSAPQAVPPNAGPNPLPAKTASPEDTNPFSNVKPINNQDLRQQLPALEQRVQQMENQMSAIQQVQVALPADALGGPRMVGIPGAPGKPAMSEAAMELEASTFVACVNGQALFRDTDQKPFFVDAKEANQNEAIRRIGGCKH